jgi:hypothetical protein
MAYAVWRIETAQDAYWSHTSHDIYAGTKSSRIHVLLSPAHMEEESEIPFFSIPNAL